MSVKGVAVFCSASQRLSPVFHSAVEELALALVASRFEIIYGGANIGLMGTLADHALAKQGVVHGVIPEQDFMDGLVHEGLKTQHKVKTLWERKAKMVDLADGFVVCPGGLGTLDEATDILTLKQVGQLPKPIVFYDVMSFWQPFLEGLSIMSQQQMIHGELDDLFVVKSSAVEICEYFNVQFFK